MKTWNKNQSMEKLLGKLIDQKVITTEKVYQAMSQVDRGEFTDSCYAYEDRPQSISYNATISAPHMHAYALEYLKDWLKPGNSVLDVGSGSGYLTVVFSKMMDDAGTVIGIEHIKNLYTKSIENISKSHSSLLESKAVIMVNGDGRQGYQDNSPYNCIHVGAASESVPQDLIDQLAPEGRLMIPVGKQRSYQSIYLIDKDSNGKVTKQDVLSVSYVPLTSVTNQLNP